MIVASGLSTRYDAVPLVKSSSIQFYGQRIEDPRATFPYERRGLSWVMALAQIELGAMRACRIDLDIPFNGIDAAALTKGDPHAASDLTYTGADLINLATGGSAGRVPNPNGKLDLLNPKNLAGAQRASVVPIQLDVIYRDRLGPFHRFRPNDSSRTAFHELLYDGARQQYYSLRLNLQIDPQRQIGVEPRAGDQIGNALSLIKRTTIAIEFLLALRDEMSSSLTARQKLELDDWENYLTTARSFFARTALNAYANAKAEQLRLNYNPRQDAALQAAPTPSKKSTNTKKSTNSNSTKGK